MSYPYPPAPGAPYGSQQPSAYQAYPPEPGAPYGYQPYPYPGPHAYPMQQLLPQVNRRPTTVTGAAVLGHVLAGCLILAGMFLLFGATVLSSMGEVLDRSTDSITAEVTVDGLLNLIAAGLLIAGGVIFCAGRSYGRLMITAGAAITLMYCTYWAVRPQSRGTATVFVAVFGMLAILALGLSFTSDAGRWLASRAGAPDPAASAPGDRQP